MKLLDRYLTAWAALTVSVYVLGYCLAVLQAYDYCMDNWRDAMSYSHDPPPDDWPGLNSCGSESERTFGVWSFVTASIPSMPVHYEGT